MGRNAYPRMFVELQYIVLVQHHVEGVEVVGQAAHLHVRPMADDDRVIAVAHERRDRAVRDMHERTGRLHDSQPERPGVRQRPL